MDYSDMAIEELIEAAEIQARNYHDGHFTILKFTTHWKVGFGTPDLDSGYPEGRELIQKLKRHPTLREALLDLLSGIKRIEEINE
jgi:hypothetical protein